VEGHQAWHKWFCWHIKYCEAVKGKGSITQIESSCMSRSESLKGKEASLNVGSLDLSRTLIRRRTTWKEALHSVARLACCESKKSSED
jgi:hypothetical protein